MIRLETIDFGKFKGKKWSEVPFEYLSWVIREIKGEKKKRAIKELEKRGTEILIKKKPSWRLIRG